MHVALLLHLSDSGFPTGGYAHSHGLEEVVRQGEVHNEDTLSQFLQSRIQPLLQRVELPLVREAHTAAGRGDTAELVEVDRLAHALRLNREACDASRRIGCRRLAILQAVGYATGLEAYAAAIAKGEANGHHAVVFGAACRNIPLRATLAAYHYQTMAGFCTASLKLIRIGQEGVHRVLAATLNHIDKTLEGALVVRRDDIGWLDPALDLAGMHHEIATERLFIS